MKRNWNRIAIIWLVLVGVAATFAPAPAEARGNRFALWMGEKVFDGKAGPWMAEARLVRPEERGELARSAGKEAPSAPPHRFLFALSEIRPKTPIPLDGWRGKVAVTGPDGTTQTARLARRNAHAGADISLPKPGRYDFLVEIEAESGKRETVAFTYTVRGRVPGE